MLAPSEIHSYLTCPSSFHHFLTCNCTGKDKKYSEEFEKRCWWCKEKIRNIVHELPHLDKTGVRESKHALEREKVTPEFNAEPDLGLLGGASKRQRASKCTKTIWTGPRASPETRGHCSITSSRRNITKMIADAGWFIDDVECALCVCACVFLQHTCTRNK